MPQIHPGFRTDYFYGCTSEVDGQLTNMVIANRIYLTLLFCPITTTFNRIGLEILKRHNSFARMGIYTNNDNEAVPEKLLLDAGVVSCNNTGIKELSINVSLIPGWYWIVALFSGTPTIRVINNGEFDDFIMGSPTTSSNGYYLYYPYAYSNENLPETIPSVSYHTSRIPFLHLRKVTD